MIVNPYNEVISLHDMRISLIELSENKAFIYLDQAFYLSSDENYILDNPLIIVNDLIETDDYKNYPVRIRLINDEEILTPTLEDFKEFSFEIIEEAYGFGLIHFFGKASKFLGDSFTSYDCFIDIHYCGDLEIKWDDKKLVEA